MHYTGTIWRPPYEAGSALVQVTAGCTHHKCKFCTLYEDVPFKFRMSPLSEERRKTLDLFLNFPYCVYAFRSLSYAFRSLHPKITKNLPIN